ncbi:MAG: hypothetical protein IKU45_04580, partial [Clostridia bacterium]|nr:hypothetical protein [Clostridia bacterium]
MNENETKNNITPNEPKAPQEKVTVYEDFEVFDLDALRKSKGQQTAKPAPAPAPKAPTQPKPTQSGQPAQRVPSGQVNRQPQQRKPVAKTPYVTNVKPDKVVFDSASESKRIPGSRKPKPVKEKRQKPIVPKEEKTRGDNPLLVLSKALIYIASVLLVSCLCAYYIIVVSND